MSALLFGQSLRVSAHIPLGRLKICSTDALPFSTRFLYNSSDGDVQEFQLNRNAVIIQPKIASPASMRESPMHKGCSCAARNSAGIPYQNEPWHWEYNPSEFREIFWSEFPGGASQREIIIDEP
jgi:hypothetical protein